MTRPPADSSDPMAEELALLAHDIRSVMTDVMAGLELMDASTLGTDNRQQLERVKASGEGLFRLLEVALSTVLGRTAEDLPMAPVHLSRLLNDLMRRFAYADAAGKPRARVVVSAAPNLPEVVMCNLVAVERVLSNLLGNALIHSGDGLVTLEVRHPDQKELCFNIVDQGPGFPSHVSDETAARAADHRALPAWQEDEGHGLGLSIALALSERMGGRIRLRNTPTGGGAAEFCLPILPVPVPKVAPAQGSATTFHGLQVLLADDSTTQLLVLSQYLGQLGAHATMVRDGGSAIAALQSGAFDVAILDHDMPGLSGPEVCARIRATPGDLARLPIVILTAHHLEEFHDQARAAGANAVLIKPISSAKPLAEALQAVLTLPTAVTETAIDPKAFLHLLDIAGADLATELITRFQEDLAAVEADLITALPELDWRALRGASHVLVALAGTAGAHILEEASRAFNTAAIAGNAQHIAEQAEALLTGLTELIAFIDNIASDRQA